MEVHGDDHYANTIFKCARKYAVICSFVCTDDKHKISVDEPNFSLASLPCGRQVLVANNESLQVGDHDLSTISLLPTLTSMAYLKT